MKILRRGATANHGYRSVDLKNPWVRWNPTADAFDVGFKDAASDFATQARHIYHLRIDPAEMAKILTQIADQAMSMETDEFIGAFGGSAPAFLRLHLLSSGIRLAT